MRRHEKRWRNRYNWRSLCKPASGGTGKGGGGGGGGSGGSGSGGSGGGGGGELTSAEMEQRVPQFGGNSRIYAARELLESGSLSQEALRDFDIATYTTQLSGLNSASIRQQTRADGTIQTFSGQTTGSTSATAYRQYVAQANRDARRIWNAASNETREAWAARGEVTNPRSSRNVMTRRISRDLSRRYERQQEAAASARRAARAARRSQSSGDDDLSGLFG